MIDSGTSTVCGSDDEASDTWTVNWLTLPGVSGTPEIAPVEPSSESPSGSSPLTTFHW